MARYYGFAYHPSCLQYLRGLDKKFRKQIINKIKALASDPFPSGSKKLRGTDGNESVHRIRSGDYRVLYIVHGEIVTVLDIGDRKDVYRSMPKVNDDEMTMPSDEFDRIMGTALGVPAPPSETRENGAPAGGNPPPQPPKPRRGSKKGG